MPLNFLQDIYNEKISLKEAKFEQRDLEKEIEKLEFNYIPKNEKEEEIDKVLMYAKSLLESRNKIIDAFKDHIFPSEHLKKTDKAAYDFMLKGVNKFIEKIKSMEEKINFSLFEDLFEFSSPADYAKTLIDISSDENKTIVAEAKDIISNLKDRIKKMSDKEKEKKMPMKHWRLLIKLLIIITRLKIFFIIHQKLIKKIRTKIEKSIAERTKLRKRKLNTIAEKNKTKQNNTLFSHYFDYLSPENMFKKLRDATDEKNKNMVESINKKLTKIKHIARNVPTDDVSRAEENEKIIDIVEKILELNNEKK